MEEARRGGPALGLTSYSNALRACSPESKLLIEAVQKLKKADTLKNRYDLYESIRGVARSCGLRGRSGNTDGGSARR